MTMNLAAMQFASGAWVAFYVITAMMAAGHALLHKRDPRSAWGWIAVCWLFPLVGAALYWLLGVNRLARYGPMVDAGTHMNAGLTAAQNSGLSRRIGGTRALRELAHAGALTGGNPLVEGNRIEPLINGDEAYPAMLAAIAAARDTVYLATYIYRDDDTGRRFAEALAQAHRRGVQVRVLLDGLSDVFYWPRASRMLSRYDIPLALFLPLSLWPLCLHVNLRNHRKLLLVDSAVAFTGGMNVAGYHMLKNACATPVADLQFRIHGPLVSQLDAVFRADWRYAAGEQLPPPPAVNAACGSAACRVVTDGPDNQLDPFMLLLIAALAAAHRSVCIMTPYFVPPAPIAAALEATALRGIEVRILLPRASDQPWIDWATRHALLPLLQQQVRVYYGAPPFAHTKLLLVDDEYVQFGSGNLDVRSLRLNFELNVEAYDHRLSADLRRHFDLQLLSARPVDGGELAARRLPERLRDACCWLFSPYL